MSDTTPTSRACELCWDAAFYRHHLNPHKGQAEHYRDLLAENEGQPGHSLNEQDNDD